MFESPLILLLWAAATYVVGNLILGMIEVLTNAKTASVTVLRQKIRDKLDEITHRVKEEKHGDMIYWFDLDDGEFLAQGLTQDDIITALKERFPDHIFFLPTDHYVGFPAWTLTAFESVDEIPSVLTNKSQ
jgi:hypothetical protein